jgi:hypothetical protein
MDLAWLDKAPQELINLVKLLRLFYGLHKTYNIYNVNQLPDKTTILNAKTVAIPDPK